MILPPRKQHAPPQQSKWTDCKETLPFFLGFMAVLGAAFFLLFVGLGIWQVERLQWKLDLIARVDARVHADPVAAPGKDEWAHINRKDDEYRHVTLTGTYLNDKEILVHALTERGSGYWVLTPMRSDAGVLIFINRGFVPGEKRDAASRAQTQIAGETTVTGLLRMPEPGGFFCAPTIRHATTGIHAILQLLPKRKIWALLHPISSMPMRSRTPVTCRLAA